MLVKQSQGKIVGIPNLNFHVLFVLDSSVLQCQGWIIVVIEKCIDRKYKQYVLSWNFQLINIEYIINNVMKAIVDHQLIIYVFLNDCFKYNCNQNQIMLCRWGYCRTQRNKELSFNALAVTLMSVTFCVSFTFKDILFLKLYQYCTTKFVSSLGK